MARGALRELLPACAVPGSAAPPGSGGAGRASRQPQVVLAKSFAVLLPGRLENILGSDSFLVLGHPHLAPSFLNIRKGLSKVEGIPYFSRRPKGCLAAGTQMPFR